MILAHLNYLAVAVCAIIYFAIGGMWFSPMLFSKAWMEGHNISMPSEEEMKAKMKKEMPKFMGFSFLMSFIVTVAIGYMQVAACTHNWMGGAKMGIIASVFVIAAFAQSHMYTRKSFKLFMIDAGYHVVALVIVGIVMAVWH